MQTIPFFICVETKKTDFHAGEEIIALGIVKDPTTNEPIISAPVELQLLSPQERLIASAAARTGRDGRFQAVLHLPSDAAEGMYQIAAIHGYSTAITSFMCRKPKRIASTRRP